MIGASTVSVPDEPGIDQCILGRSEECGRIHCREARNLCSSDLASAGVFHNAQQWFRYHGRSPWLESVDTAVAVETVEGGLTRGGYQARWAAMAAQEPRRALAYLLYLGFEGYTSQVFRISRPRRLERVAEQPERSVYQVRRWPRLRSICAPPPGWLTATLPTLPKREAALHCITTIESS